MRTAILLTGVLLTLSACGGKSTDSGSQSAKSNPPSTQVSVSTVKQADVKTTLTAYGTVEYAPAGAHVVSAKAEQMVVRMLVAAGQQVHKGEALLTIAPGSASLLQLDSAKVDIRFARQQVDHSKSLRDRGLATNADVQSAEKNLASVQTQLSNLEKRLGGSKTHSVRSEFSGVVQTVNVQTGQIVTQGSPLLTIGDASLARVRLGVEQDALPQLHAGQKVQIESLNSGGTAVASTVSALFPQIDAKTRLATAIVTLPAGHGFLPGAIVRASIVTAEAPQALVVPRAAVLYDKQKSYLFVDQNDKAQRREVQTGIEDGQVIQITQGVAIGDPVIVAGNAELSDGAAVRKEPSQ
jgi:membrane fusion protein (multidrug efflux system)